MGYLNGQWTNDLLIGIALFSFFLLLTTENTNNFSEIAFVWAKDSILKTINEYRAAYQLRGGQQSGPKSGPECILATYFIY